MNSPSLNVLIDEIEMLTNRIAQLEAELEQCRKGMPAQQPAKAGGAKSTAQQLKTEASVPEQAIPLLNELLKIKPKTTEQIIRLVFFKADEFKVTVTPQLLNSLITAVATRLHNLVPVDPMLTVGELKQKLEGLPLSMPVFVDAELSTFSYWPLVWETQVEPKGTFANLAKDYPDQYHLVSTTDDTETIAALGKYTLAFNAFVSSDTKNRKAFIISPHY